MLFIRKIQLTSIAVIANGALALGVLSSQPAFAAGCAKSFQVICGAASICANGANLCLPAGHAQSPSCTGTMTACTATVSSARSSKPLGRSR